jgi:hypothetical protein
VASPAVWEMSKHSMRKVQVVGGQVQRLGQRARAGLLRALFGQQARQLQAGVGRAMSSQMRGAARAAGGWR